LCSVGTSKPKSTIFGSISIGEAAHIYGNNKASNNRFDILKTKKELSQIKNGIWLCRVCHKKIDSDQNKYTVDFLIRTKENHEERISNGYFDKLHPEYVDQQEINHDKAIFSGSEKYLNEEKMKSFISGIRHWTWIDLNEEDFQNMQNYRDYHSAVSNRYLKSSLTSKYRNLDYAVTKLFSIMIEYQNRWESKPRPQVFTSLRAVFGLEAPGEFYNNPLSRIFGSYSVSYNMYKYQLNMSLDDLHKAYEEYRTEIKKSLFI
jgi:hypothetical protein